jgi:hypothetical protein
MRPFEELARLSARLRPPRRRPPSVLSGACADRRVACAHEAGHAVYAVAAGLQLVDVEIHDDGTGGCRAHLNGDRRTELRWVVAGVVAEMEHVYPWDMTEYDVTALPGTDRERVERLLDEITLEVCGPPQPWDDPLFRLRLQQVELENAVRDVRGVFARTNRRAVFDALLAAGRLTGAQVKAAMRTLWT